MPYAVWQHIETSRLAYTPSQSDKRLIGFHTFNSNQWCKLMHGCLGWSEFIGVLWKTFFLCCLWRRRVIRKHVYGHMRTANAQIRLRIRAVWSGPSLSANRIVGYYRMFQRKANAQMSFRACAEWCKSTHFAHARRNFFAWRSLLL